MTALVWALALACLLAPGVSPAQVSSSLADKISPPLPEEVPNVKGMKLDQALEALGQAGFQVRAIPKLTFFPGQDRRVFDQSPSGGTAINFKMPVIEVYYYDKDYQPAPKQPKATGGEGRIADNQVVMPDLAGQTLENAISTLNRLGLYLEVREEMDAFEFDQDGTIFSQSPLADTKVDKGSTVWVIVLIYSEDSESSRSLLQRKLRKGSPSLPPLESGGGFGEEGEETDLPIDQF